MVLGYADSLYLAGLVWALVLAEDRRWWAAGLLAAVATASRPNGWIAVVAVVVTVLVARAGARALVAVAGRPSPSSSAGARTWTGRPAIRSCSGRRRTRGPSSRSRRCSPTRSRTAHWPALFHLAFVLAADRARTSMRARRQPLSWAVVVVLTVLPPFVLGVVGLARYAILAFPMPFAAADVLTTRRRWPAVAFLSASGAAMVFLAVMINYRSWLP